jgi:hypothetical protein
MRGGSANLEAVARPRKPDPEVLEGDYRIPAAVGTVAWGIALVILLLMRDGLPAEEQWWIWVCVTGMGLGIFAFLYIPRLQRKRGGLNEPG